MNYKSKVSEGKVEGVKVWNSGVGWVERSETQQRGNSLCTMKRQSSLIKDELAQGEVIPFRLNI